MKISVIITAILITQVSASFFDVFQGAVLSVQNSFGKLLTDVVTDVRDTVDCTILAVEHVLSLSNDATAQYYEKCGNGNKTDSASGTSQDVKLPKVEGTLEFSKKEVNLQKEVLVDIDAKINESLSKILGNYNPRDNLLNVENVLAKESKQLAEVGNIVKQELNKLSNDVHTDLMNTKQRDSEPSVDTILQEIKLLESKERNTKNTSEATEIHKVIDEVLAKLDVIEVTEASENIKLDEILRNLEKNSNNSFNGLRQQFEEWKEEESSHLSEIKNKIEEHEKNAVVHEYIYKNHISNYTPPGQLNPGMLKSIELLEIEGPTEEESSHTKILLKETINNSGSVLTEGRIQIKDVLLNNITKTGETINKVSLTSIKNESTTRAYTKIDHMLNDTIATSTAAGNNASSTFSTNTLTTIQEKESYVSNGTLASTTFPTVDDTSSRLVKTTMGSKEQESLLKTISPKTAINKNELNVTMTKNSINITESIPIGGVVHSVEVDTKFNEEVLPTVTTNVGLTALTKANIISKKENVFTSTSNGTETELSLTMQIPSNTDMSNVATITSTAVPISETVKTERAAYKESPRFNSHKLRALEFHDNHSYGAVRSTSTENITESGTIIPVENNKTLADTDSNDTKMMSAKIQSTSIGKTMQTIETIAVFGSGESSVTINNFTTSPVNIDNNVLDNITSNAPLTSIPSTPVTDIIQLVKTTEATTTEEPLTTAVHIPNVNIIDDSVFTSSPTSILGRISTKSTTSAENEVSSTTTRHRMVANVTNAKIITSTLFATSETTPIGEINLPDKSSTLIANEEPSTLTATQPPDILNKITNHNKDENDAGTTPHLIAEDALANRSKQAVEIGANLEKQKLTSTFGPQKSTVFTLTEKTPIKRETTLPIKSTTRHAENRDVYTLTTNSFSPTPKIHNIRDLNHVVTNRPTFALTVDPFMKMNIPLLPLNPTKRPWLPQMKHDMPPNKLNPKIYPNTNRLPRKHNYSNNPQSLRDRGSHLNPTIPRGKSTIPARNLYRDPYFAPTIKKENVPRRPEGRNNANPPSVQRQKNRIQPPYSWGDDAPNINISPTYRPVSPTVTRKVNNNDKAPLDYDSFFETNNEAHQRALREARALIENSKRSHRIIDAILKNKNHYGARSIFNNAGPLNR